MISFKDFLVSENQKDIEDTLKKIPSGHAKLIKSYKIKFQPGNTLKGDNDHVGYIDNDPDEIVIAAPWHYGREFTMLHEIAHRVYERLSPELRKKWKALVKVTKNKPQQNVEELFCMTYAANYAKHPPTTYCIDSWLKFIKNLPHIKWEKLS